MRVDLLNTIGRPDRQRVWPQIAVTATAAMVAVAGAAQLPAQHDQPALMMGRDELSPTLRRAAEMCLQLERSHEPVPVSIGDLAVAAELAHKRSAVMLFMSEHGYVECQTASPDGSVYTDLSSGWQEWQHPDWLPGPIQVLGFASAEFYGGEVAAVGRVSARVHRLVLDHGDGETTPARLEGGAFGLLTEAAVTPDSALVSYDATGREIDRRRLFDEPDRCYTDPEGTVLYGTPGPDCQPADPWTR